MKNNTHNQVIEKNKMTGINMTHIIPANESEMVELKTTFCKDVVETVVAFSNSKGGTVYIGISDRGEIQGVQIGKETVQTWIIEQLLSNTYVSMPCNRQIAKITKEMGLIEKYGTGIKRVLDIFKNYGLPQPRFELIPEGFAVTVFSGNREST